MNKNETREKRERKMKRAIIEAALNIDELASTLRNISEDDRKQISDYSDAEIVHEAKYVLSTFFEGGHINNDSLTGEMEHDECNAAWARREVKKLRSLIRKYNC